MGNSSSFAISLCVILFTDHDTIDQISKAERDSEVSVVSGENKSTVDGAPACASVFRFVIYNGEGTMGKQASRYLLRNKIEKK
jgi:hypothetical protein